MNPQMTSHPISKRSQTVENVLRIVPERPNRIEVDSRVQLYPTIAFPIADGSVWRVLVHGRMSHDAPVSFSKRLMLKGLVRALELSKEVSEGNLFAGRVEGFLASPISGHRVQVELAGQHYILRRKTKRSGLFNCKLDLPANQLDGYRRFGLPFLGDSNRRLEFSSTWDECPVLLAEEKGISVITDIDDTIKLTEVNSRRRMLHRTFAEPFEPIEGMAQAYQHWANQGALFHYVSSSPWQIYSPLKQFLAQYQFPIGSMHLKWFRLRDEIFKRWQILRRKSKAGIIRFLIKRMPLRTFVLIGDSGERDPEIYAKLASKFPHQVARICIRQVDANPLDAERLDAIYSRHGMTVPIQVFSQPYQLGELMPSAL